MIYLHNNTNPQPINIPYSTQPDRPITKEVQGKKTFYVNSGGYYDILPDSGYSSMKKVELTVDVDTQDVYESGYTDGYTTGYTEGFESGHTDGLSEGFVNGAEWRQRQDIDLVQNRSTGLTITQNGHYDAPIDPSNPLEGWISAVTVNVSGGSPAPVMQEKNVSAITNGTFSVSADSGYDGLSVVNVDVNVPSSINNQNKSITANTNGHQTITYDSGYTGLGTVDVDVNVPANNQNKSITANTNGHQTITFDSGYTGLGTVDIDVNVPTIGKIKSETTLSISPVLRIYKSSSDHSESRQLNIGVSFDNIPTVKTKFMSVLGINFFIDASKISAECNKFNVDWSLDIFNGVNANVNYSLLFTAEECLIINGTNFGPDADDYSNSSYSGQTTIGSSSLVMDLNFFEYIDENGVNTVIKDQMAESGVTFSGQTLQPALSDGDFSVTGNGSYHFSKPDDGSYGMRIANVWVNVPIVPAWKNYRDNTFKYVREDCTNNGTYMCHIINFDLSKFGAVDVYNGVITGATYGNMQLAANGHWYAVLEYNNVNYWLECWTDNGKIYWFSPNAIVAQLDAYGTGSDLQGWYLP